MSTLLAKEIVSKEVGQFALFLHAYKECSAEIQAIVDEMTEIITSAESTEEDRDHAGDTIIEALMPGLMADVAELHRNMLRSEVAAEASLQLAAEEETFADRVKAAMREKGLSQLQLAEKAGVTQPAISNILSRKMRPQRRTVAKIAEALDMAPEELWPA